MRIALMGSRGIPATYSGFETFYEQLAIRLVARGHLVTVYNRSHHHSQRLKEFNGVRIVTLPTIRSKHLDTPVHAFLSLCHALWQGADILYMVIVGNSPLCLLAHLAGRRMIINVDGADFAREKWRGLAKIYLRWSEGLAARHADVVIADSRVIVQRYLELYQRQTVFIPYGANPKPRDQWRGGHELLARHGLRSDHYILFVSRMTPENRAHVLIKAWRKSGSKLRLVLVGDAPYVDDYKDEVAALCEDADIVRTGYLVGEDYKHISAHCRYFVLPSGIDGTRPVLLDQMALGNCVLVRNTPANMEVIGDAGLSFEDSDDEASLALQIQRIDADDELLVTMRQRALIRVTANYSWDAVTDQYEALFRSLQR